MRIKTIKWEVKLGNSVFDDRSISESGTPLYGYENLVHPGNNLQN